MIRWQACLLAIIVAVHSSVAAEGSDDTKAIQEFATVLLRAVPSSRSLCIEKSDVIACRSWAGGVAAKEGDLRSLEIPLGPFAGNLRIARRDCLVLKKASRCADWEDMKDAVHMIEESGSAQQQCTELLATDFDRQFANLEPLAPEASRAVCIMILRAAYERFAAEEERKQPKPSLVECPERDYSKRLAEIERRAQDARERARQESTPNFGQKMAAVIGDAANAMGGGAPGSISSQVMTQREQKLESDLNAIEERRRSELLVLDAERQECVTR